MPATVPSQVSAQLTFNGGTPLTDLLLQHVDRHFDA